MDEMLSSQVQNVKAQRRRNSFSRESHSESYSDGEFSPSSVYSSRTTSDRSYLSRSMPSAPTYAVGEYEDEKAAMIAKPMKYQANFVTSSLVVQRSTLIQSVIWLSRHVPGCVIKSLFESITRARKKRAKVERLRHQPQMHDLKEHETKRGSPSAGVCDTKTEGGGRSSSDEACNDTKPEEKAYHNSALLLVDISGFTKISVMMDVESLSNAINSYFQMIVNEITTHGGDVLKFAGDALFAEWKVSHQKPHRNLEHCVSIAANCAAAIVANCSDYAVLSKPIGFTMSSRRTSLVSRRDSARSSLLSQPGESTGGGSPPQTKSPLRRRTSSERKYRASMSADVATLNVKCGVGAGRMVGIHVGDGNSRREFLILGDPIGQVVKAESAASHGEVFASPEALQLLSKVCNLRGDCSVKDGWPMKIASRNERFFEAKKIRLSRRESSMSGEAETMLRSCDDLDSTELLWLKGMICLYVHPVVVNDDNESVMQTRRESDQERHVAEAELRNVFTCFITPLIDYRLTGDKKKDQKLFSLLNDIMNVTTKELDKVHGHLRQFILDDKGLVLICTFGLRGSTFPNMIAQRALPFTLSIHRALQEELGIKNTVGATLGRVYCGVVGGLERHEYSVLGPSINLAARLMACKSNPGILVDKNVRLLASQVFFKPLPAVKAKGYDEPVPIFEPTKNTTEQKWGQSKKKFVGRSKEIKQIMRVAKDMVYHGSVSKFLFVSAMSGTGKSTLIFQATEHVRAMIRKLNRKVIVTRNISNEGDSRIPFSLFRSFFRDVLTQVRQDDEESQASMSQEEAKRRASAESSAEFSIDGQWDNLNLPTQSSLSSTMSTDATRFRYICQELNAPTEFMEVVGTRLLGLRERNSQNPASKAKPPNLQEVVDFMADAFIRCTKHANLVLLALDDVQWMDEMTWKVVQAIFERGENVFIICGSRPLSSNPLSVDPTFWSDLQDKFQKENIYSELNLGPFTESEVQEVIAATLELKENEIDSSFSRNLFNTCGGMPHYLSYVLDTIKRNKLTVRLENDMVGMESSSGNDNMLGFGSVGELRLYRLDALDSSVRIVLHLSAVLGMEFDLLDAALAYEESLGVDDSQRLDAAIVLRAAFDVAIEEGIIDQSFAFTKVDDGGEDMLEEDEEENHLIHSMGNVTISLTGRKAHPFYTENRRLRFTHDSWKKSILSTMLDERKQEMHEHVAKSLERELDDEPHNQDDFEKQIRVLNHWRSSGNFLKSASLGLNIGSKLMILGLNTQAILLFDDVLNILKEMGADKRSVAQHGGISATVLDAVDAPELEYLIKLNIQKGKALTTLRRGKDGAEAYQSALDLLNNTPCADDEEFDRSVAFQIFSGLFALLKMGDIKQDKECSYEKELCKNFVEQARLNGDPVHHGRALAMEADSLGRLGNYEQALEVVERIKSIYNIETHHEAVCKAYASDRVAQAYAHSVNFNYALGRIQETLDTCNYIVEEILPKSDPKNIHNAFCLLYAVTIFLKENGMSLKAQHIFQTWVVDQFEEHFGPGGSTYSKPMFKPILTMLELQGTEELEVEKIDEYTTWALDDASFEQKILSCEVTWASYSASPKAVHSEICFSLAKRQRGNKSLHRHLLKKAISLMEQSVATAVNLPFPNMYARKKLETMKEFAKDCC